MPKDSHAPRRAIVYCIVPEDLADRLHEPLRRYYADSASVEVVVEQRREERRRSSSRRTSERGFPAGDHRRIRNVEGRRVGARRAPALSVDEPHDLPRVARAHAARLVFIERIEPAGHDLEDLDTARVVMRVQTGDTEAFRMLYLRYFERIYAYFHVVLRNGPDAEEATQQVFMKVLEALPRYELRKVPFRGWLFRIARNQGVDALKLRARVAPVDPIDLEREIDGGNRAEIETGTAELPVLDWISDRDLLLFIERLPMAQRQVLLLRFMHDLSYAEIATILERSQEDVRKLQQRGIAFLRSRLTAVGRAPESGRRSPWRRQPTYLGVLRARRYALH